jgi:hypothetical protein
MSADPIVPAEKSTPTIGFVSLDCPKASGVKPCRAGVRLNDPTTTTERD